MVVAQWSLNWSLLDIASLDGWEMAVQKIQQNLDDHIETELLNEILP